MTRPEISYTAHQLVSGENRGTAHWNTAKKALQYLWHRKGMGLIYVGETGGNTKLSVRVNADFGPAPTRVAPSRVGQ